jgi:iron complex outermembrane receptor protein
MFNRRVSLDGAIFYYDYKDKQLRSKYVDPVFGVLDKLANIPKSSIKGAEMSLNANLTAGLSANLSVTYLDSTINEFVGVNGLGIQSNYAGTSIPFAPKFSTTAGLEYDWPLSNTLTGFAGANVTTNSKTYSVVGNDPASLIESFVLVDVRAGVETTDGKWRAQLWGKNITDRYYWTNAVVVYDQEVRYAGQPATFGITASYRYK